MRDETKIVLACILGVVMVILAAGICATYSEVHAPCSGKVRTLSGAVSGQVECSNGAQPRVSTQGSVIIVVCSCPEKPVP